MTYKINGTTLLIQPTTGRWVPRRLLGMSGDAHPIYPALRDYELIWGLVTPTEVNQLQTFFDSVAATGTVVADLPKYNDATYSFYAYSGCTLREPEISPYFAQNITDVRLLVSKIST